MAILIGCSFVQAQRNSKEMFEKFDRILNFEIQKPVNIERNKFNFVSENAIENADDIRNETGFNSLSEHSLTDSKQDKQIENLETDFFETAENISVSAINSNKLVSKLSLKKSVNEKGFDWQPAIVQSLYFLTIQHSFRMLQKKTTRELDGPFFRDWANSVKNLGRWRDGDSTFTNYVAHPMQGAVTGRIFINNSEKSKKLEFGNSKEYRESRLKAMIWSAAWSTQFELGPFSEASIGNVGLYDRQGPNRMGYVDIFVTPLAGTAVLIGEDIIDKYILKKWLERKAKNRRQIIIMRTFITPFLSFSNALRGKYPWKRDNR
jgi:hypothetical protein